MEKATHILLLVKFCKSLFLCFVEKTQNNSLTSQAYHSTFESSWRTWALLMYSVEALIGQAPRRFCSKWKALFFCLITMSIISNAEYQKWLLSTGSDTVFSITSRNWKHSWTGFNGCRFRSWWNCNWHQVAKVFENAGFHIIHFILPGSFDYSAVTLARKQQNRAEGSSLNITELIINYLIVEKSFPIHSIITVAHTSTVGTY